ncbi:MAG: hypothetical protein R3A79_22965 [Nannocystaceae bacterium]
MSAGIAQIFAGIILARVDGASLAAVATEGSTPYILGVSGVMAAWLGAYVLRARLGIGLGLALLGTVLAVGLASRFGDALGVVYYGELIFHHFLALLSAAIVALVGHGLLRQPEYGRLRGGPLVLASLGALLLLGQHVASIPALALDAAIPGLVGTVTIVAAILAAAAVAWPRLGWSDRGLVVAVLAPLGVRLALGGEAGLMGAAPGVSAALPMVTALTITSVYAFFVLRPRVDVVGRALSLVAGLAVSYRLHSLYYAPRFDVREERFGGLVRSIVGFDLPYPSFVADWKVATATVAIFALVAAIVAAALDPRRRGRAAALALVFIAGFGLTSPQLVLMHAAGVLALIAALADAPIEVVEPVLAPPPEEPELILCEVAERLELEPPVVVEEAAETVIALRGEHRRSAVDLRARSADGQRWHVTLRCGVVGRGRPEAEVLPGGDGHRLRGDVSRVGSEENGVLDRLAAFPAATARFWQAGCEVDFGDDLTRLSGASLEALIRAIGRVLA